MMRVAEAIRIAAQTLAPISDTARLDAELLMAHAMGKSRSELLLQHMAEPEPAAYAALIERRRRQEPVAYITGFQEFFGLEFAVTPDVLIPRGDSEVLVVAALAVRPDARSVLDCGTGSGALLLSVLANLPRAKGMGIDCSVPALNVARANHARLMDRVGTRAMMLERDWSTTGWAEDLGTFDLILANPPYVEDDAELAASVRAHEPAGALFAGAEGLDAYRVLIPQLPGLLAPGGLALVEIGHRQAEAVGEIARAAGFAVELHHDLGARPRALALQIPLGNTGARA